MAPDATVAGRQGPVIRLDKIAPGTQQTVISENEPVFVRHLTPAQRDEAREQIAAENLYNPLARNANLSAGLLAHQDTRMVAGHAIVIVTGRCTRRGCVPILDSGDFDGWFCPCCAAHYDVLGRIRKGIAPRNLAIPRYRVLSDHQVRLLPHGAGPNRHKIDDLLFGPSDRG
ncbi:ubiquinol-cytochrome c reductase iron-sulfur subunit [Actibacterium sp. 188UL27-1]|uniref:ubiquinol-cytochrome c reductase iron-sulfur subunit n=1 Tax=Actibacterium sp. 188UL27-1 TaxID=2786961 RepID=UPI001957AACD|nr:ubiquinol-cytochrome c reductase iron-sulfur subunit [Actibacterium sp. 188UL27-1]MBM7068053.1 ubiquinol-cytochrome c reductase iron-sulfur subunit [Actibacterium sp. 188UL27-1]